jgi:aryl-alcohol dehydrogenase-like predicted oxidoreductase
MEQPQYNLFHRDRFEKEYGPLYERIGLGTTIWSPLAGGLLTGKYVGGVPDGTRSTLKGYEWLRSRYDSKTARAHLDKIEQLSTVAADLGCSLAQLAIAWCVSNPHVSTAILGASRSSQLEENLGAIGVVDRLTDDVIEHIEEIVANRPEPEPDLR